MSRPVDEKIVRMTLDNARFKDRVKETLQSFNSINDATKNSGNMDLSGMAKGISTIESRFSAMGVVAATVIKRITDSAIDMGKKLFTALVDPIVEGGKKRAMNIEQAQFQFQGLGMDVEATMASANEAVLGTAFGLDEAAVVAAQFGASGMRAGEDMTRALRGISGVAAMTGSSYTDVGNIFTKVAGNGRLMGDDLLRLSARGVNAAATLADAMNLTEQEVRAMVTAGEISFDDFATAMSEAFGEHATRANETYTGSLSNMRAALARTGAAFYQPNLTKMRDLFNTITPIVDAMNDAIGPLIEALVELNDDAIQGLINGLETVDFAKFDELGGITNLVDTFWNVMNFGKGILSAVGTGFRNMFPGGFMASIIGVTENLKNLTSNLTISTESGDKLAIIFQGMFSIFSTVFEIAKTLGQAIFGIIPEGTGGGVLDFLVIIAEMAIAFNESVKEGNFLTEAIEGIGKVLGAVGEWLKTPIQHLKNFGNAIRDNIGPALEWLSEKLAPVADFFADAFSGFGGEQLLGGGFLVAIALFLQKLSGFFDNAKENLDGITGAISGVFDDLGGALQAFQEQVKYKNLLLIAISVGILAVSLKILEGMSVQDISKGIAALAGSMAILAGGMALIQGISLGFSGISTSLTIIALAVAVTIMAGALKKISDLNPSELITGLAGLVGIVTALSLAVIAISKFGGKIGTSSLALIALATAVTILASAVVKMSEIDTGDLFKAVGALALIFAQIALFLIVVKGSKIGPGTALGLLGIAGAIHIIVGAISKIADIDTKTLGKGLIVIGIILAELALFSKVAGGPRMLAAGAGILIIATSLHALMGPITTMGKMSWKELAKGLGGMAVALVAVGVAGSAASGSLLGAAGILVMAVALNALMPPILIFSRMSWTQMLKGFVGLAGGMTVLAVASMLLSPAILPMLGFGAALLAIGIAVTLAGAGIALFGVGLTTLATLTATSVGAIITALGMLIRGLGTLIVDVVKFVVDLGSALLGGIATLIPELIIAAGSIIIALIETLAKNTPRFVDAGFNIVIGILTGIKEKAPELIMAAFEMIVALIDGMADALEENGTDIVNSMVRLMGEVIIVVIEAGISMIEALFGWIPGIEKATAKIGDTAEDYIREHFGAEEVGVDKGEEFITGLESTSPRIKTTAEKIALQGMEGAGSVDYTNTGVNMGANLNTGFINHRDLLNTTGIEVAQSGKKGADSVDLTETGETLGEELNKGLDKQNRSLNTTGTKIAESSKTGAASVNLTRTGTTLGTELNTGLSNRHKHLNTTGTNLASSAKTGASSVSMTTTGTNFGNSFAKGIGGTSWFVQRKASALARTASSAVNSHLMIRSPSKLMTKAGRFFGDGFSGGIGDRIRTVGSKAKEMAIRASTALRDSLEAIKPEDEVIRFKLILDDDDFNPEDFDPDFPFVVQPDIGYTSAMMDTADNEFRQNGNKNNKEPEESTVIKNEYNYEIGVTAGGNMSRTEVKKLAKDIQTELKNEDDKDRMSRGEAVVF